MLNCEIARYIKHSILQLKYLGEKVETWYEDRYPYNLTYLRTKDALCLFYIKNDSIIYYYVRDWVGAAKQNGLVPLPGQGTTILDMYSFV